MNFKHYARMKKTILITICVGIVFIVLLAIVGGANTRYKESSSIVQVLNERKKALTNSERTPGNGSTLSIANYSAALKMIDVSGCP